MLSDANPMVVANALAAMQEIQEVSGKEVLQITPHTLFKLLAALNECTEWGQVGRACTGKLCWHAKAWIGVVLDSYQDSYAQGIHGYPWLLLHTKAR